MVLVTWQKENDVLPLSQICPENQLNLFITELIFDYQVEKSCIKAYQIGQEIDINVS